MCIPGYVDLQVNGYNGVDFSSPKLTKDDVLKAADQLLKSGTFIFLPTIITSSMDLYKRNLELIHKAIESKDLSDNIPGIHLEGPFLSSSPGAIGAHNPDWVQEPKCEILDELIKYSGDYIKILTVAAEVSGMKELVVYAKEKGIVVSLGHQLANSKEIESMAEAGATALTHLGNGVSNELPRHNNPIWAGLANDALSAMIITDGHHLPPELIKCFIKVKGINNIIIVSDASPAAGYVPGKYCILGNDAVLEKNGKLHNPEKGCLVGSASTIIQCVDYLRSLELLSEDEIEQAAFYNPLKLIGM